MFRFVFCLAFIAFFACSDSKTVKEIAHYAERVCACENAACAKAVEAEFLTWKEENRRARGAPSDRKEVEKAFERYAACHAKLVKEEKTQVLVPQIQLAPENLTLPN